MKLIETVRVDCVPALSTNTYVIFVYFNTIMELIAIHRKSIHYIFSFDECAGVCIFYEVGTLGGK